MERIPVSLGVEGKLDETVLKMVILQSSRPFDPDVCYGKAGKADLWSLVPKLNQAARFKPFIIVADLDEEACPIELVQKHLTEKPHPNLVLRIAVREIESWLLADRERIAEYLGVPVTKLPYEPDLLVNPKEEVVKLARKSRKREIREDLVPPQGSTSKTGRNYVGQLTKFVNERWSINEETRRVSPSLHRAMLAIERFNPQLPSY